MYECTSTEMNASVASELPMKVLAWRSAVSQQCDLHASEGWDLSATVDCVYMTAIKCASFSTKLRHQDFPRQPYREISETDVMAMGIAAALL